MSRTIKGQKGAGYEYWSRRNHKDMTRPGRISKKTTTRYERRHGKQQVHETQRATDLDAA